MEHQPHWAEDLQPGDIVLAFIRHPTEGSLNQPNIPVMVENNQQAGKLIEALLEPGNSMVIPYCELTQAKVVNLKDTNISTHYRNVWVQFMQGAMSGRTGYNNHGSAQPRMTVDECAKSADSALEFYKQRFFNI